MRRLFRLSSHFQRQPVCFFFFFVCEPILRSASLVSYPQKGFIDRLFGEGKDRDCKDNKLFSVANHLIPKASKAGRRCQLRRLAMSKPFRVLVILGRDPSVVKMPEFQVGVKRVVDYAVRIRVAADNKGVDLSNVC